MITEQVLWNGIIGLVYAILMALSGGYLVTILGSGARKSHISEMIISVFLGVIAGLIAMFIATGFFKVYFWVMTGLAIVGFLTALIALVIYLKREKANKLER